MTDKYQETRKIWDKNHPRIIKASKAKYEDKNPTWAFRPTPELKEWLESQRWDEENGKPETNAALMIRKLTKLMNLENQGY